MDNRHLRDLIDRQFDDQEEIMNHLLEKISEPYSDRPNPITLDFNVYLDDYDNQRKINCTLVYEVEWQFYDNINKYGPQPSHQLEHLVIYGDDIEIEDYELINILDLSYDSY